MIQIQGFNPAQRILADLIWNAPSTEEVNELVKKFGHDARVVRDMILYAVIDDELEHEIEFKLAEEVIEMVK